MRPQELFPIFAPVTDLGGIGPRMASLLARVAGPNVVDLCWHFPTGLIDRRFTPRVAEAPAGRVITIRVEIDRHFPPPPHNRRAVSYTHLRAHET